MIIYLQARIKQLVDSMREAGIDQATARKLLEGWKSRKSSETDTGSFLRSNSWRPITLYGIQALMDALVTYLALSGAYNISQVQLVDAGFFGETGKFLVEMLLYGSGFYYATATLADLIFLYSTVNTALQFSSETDEYIKAVEMLAGDKTGLTAVDRAKKAASAARVVEILNDVASLMNETVRSGDNTDKRSKSTLENLEAYLLLSNAEEKRGFSKDSYGLSDGELAKIARLFNRFDTNSDFKLERQELRALVCSLQDNGNAAAAAACNVSGEDIDGALRILDQDKNGYVDFDEFVKWYTSPQVAATTSMLESIEE